MTIPEKFYILQKNMGIQTQALEYPNKWGIKKYKIAMYDVKRIYEQLDKYPEVYRKFEKEGIIHLTELNFEGIVIAGSFEEAVNLIFEWAKKTGRLEEKKNESQ